MHLTNSPLTLGLCPGILACSSEREVAVRIQEIRSLSSEELSKQLNDSYRELLNLRFRLATRQLVNQHEIRNVRRRVARIRTVMRERELREGQRVD